MSNHMHYFLCRVDSDGGASNASIGSDSMKWFAASSSLLCFSGRRLPFPLFIYLI
jgi:hypothetical protein